jgi:hypothetical protein
MQAPEFLKFNKGVLTNMAKKQQKNDPRPLQAIPAEGQETHDGWSGFIPAEKFSETAASQPYDHDEMLESPARSGLQPRKKK